MNKLIRVERKGKLGFVRIIDVARVIRLPDLNTMATEPQILTFL